MVLASRRFSSNAPPPGLRPFHGTTLRFYDPAERWCFRDIAPGPAPESFRWTGEVSTDGRRTWRLDEEMLIRRHPG